jgi:hypothetical protein
MEMDSPGLATETGAWCNVGEPASGWSARASREVATKAAPSAAAAQSRENDPITMST